MRFQKSVFVPALLAALSIVGTAVAQVQQSDAASAFDARLSKELGVAGGLTAESLAQSAVASSYSMQAKRAQVDAAESSTDRAKWGYMPKVTLAASYTRLSEINPPALGSIVVAPQVPEGIVNPNTDMLVSVPFKFPQVLNQYSFTAGLLVPVTDYFLRVAPSAESSALNEKAARLDVDSTARTIATDARGLYYAWVGARLSAIVAELSLDQARAHGEDIKHALDAGTASPADKLRVDSRIAEAERSLETARHQSLDLEEQIRIARHDPESSTYTIGEDVRGDAAPGALSDDLRSLLRFALEHRPELAAMAARSEAAARAVRLERAAYLPRLDLFADAQYQNPNQRYFPQEEKFRATWDAGARLSWVVTDAPAAVAAANSAEANALALRAEVRAQEDRIRREVSAALQARLNARASLRTSKTGLDAAEESYRVRRALFQNGRATSTELLDAELELTRARLASLSAGLELRMATARLLYAVGEGKPSA